MDALRRPGPFRAVPPEAWPDCREEPGSWVRTPSPPTWTAGQEDQDGGSSASSVSSGRLSGSSGGHEPCFPPRGPWRERPPQAPGHQQQPRKRDPRLEQLRDKIRAQAQWQGSCASLGTSVPSGTSRLSKAPAVALQRKTRKVTSALAVPVPWENAKRMKSSSYKSEKAPRLPVPSRAAKSKDSELVGVYAWRRGQALVRSLLGPPPARPGLQSKPPSRQPAPAADLGADERAPAAEGSPGSPWLSRPTSAHSDQLASRGPPATVHTALAVLQDLRQQIQAGLEMAQHPRGARRPKPQNPSGRRQPGLPSAQAAQGASPKSPWTVATEGTRSSLGRARSFHSQRPWSSLTERKPSLQRASRAKTPDPSFPRPRGPAEGSGLFPERPWSALAGQAYPQKNRAAQGQDCYRRPRSPAEGLSRRPGSPAEGLSRRPGSPAERLSRRPGSPAKGLSRRPRSPAEGLSSSGRPPSPLSPWATYEDRKVHVSRPWSPLERPGLSPKPSWSSSFLQKAGPPPWGAKQAWPRHPRGQDTPRPRPQKAVEQPHSSESLRDFMRRKAQARQQQALEQKARTAHTLDLRNQRLQEVYQKQREAMLGKAFPMVSQTKPSIVTFVPSSAQAGDLEVPGSLGLQEWSKVTSGKVLGDQEAPGSFCLCLNRAWNRAETPDSRGRLDSMSGAPLLPSTASWAPPKLEDLPQRLCIYVEPWEAEALGRSPLQFHYKQARLQALETMADVLKQRIDILTAKLRRTESPDTGRSLASDLPRSGPGPVPATPTLTSSAFPDMVPSGGRAASADAVRVQPRSVLPAACFPDAETWPWSSRWEPQSPSTPAYLQSQAKDIPDEDEWELEKRPRGASAPLQALSTYTRSSSRTPATVNPTSSSLWLEEVPSARAAGLVTPWTGRSCGQQEQRPEHPPGGRFLAKLRLKSRSFLQSLKLDQRKQEKALSLLRQRAEQEVWETQMALEGLLFKHQLEELMQRHSAQASPEKALTLEEPQPCGGSKPVTARPRSVPARGRVSRASSQSPAATPRSRAGLAPSAAPKGFRVAMLEQSLHEEELHARHQASLLRLRELALEEKERTELAWLDHQRGCLEIKGEKTAELSERKQQAISKLEKERREVRYLKNCSLAMHQGRKQLLQRQKAILEAQRSVAHLRQELQALAQSPSGRVKDVLKGSPKTSQQPKRALCLLPLPDLQPPRSLQSSAATQPHSEQQATPPQTTWEADDLEPGGEDTPEASSPQVKSAKQASQAREEQPRVPLHSSSPDVGQLPGPDFPAIQAAGRPPAQLRPQEAKDLPPGKPPGDSPWAPPVRTWPAASPPSGRSRPSLVPSHQARTGRPPRTAGDTEPWWPPALTADPFTARRMAGSVCCERWAQAAAAIDSLVHSAWESEYLLLHRGGPDWEELPGDPATKPRPSSADGYARGFHGQSREGPHGPQEASVAEVVDVARSPQWDTQERQSWQSGKQRVEAWQQEDPSTPSVCGEASPPAACPAPAASEEEAPPAAPGPGSFLPELTAALDLPSPSSSVGSASSLSCSSLQEFEKVTATRVQLSDSSPSPASAEAEISPGAGSSGSGEFFALDSQEFGWPLSCDLHQEHPSPGAAPGDKGQVSWQRAEGRGVGSPCSSTEEAAEAEGPGPECLLHAGQPPPSPESPSPGSGSELSEVSSRIWEEDSDGRPAGPSPGAELASGSPHPADGSSSPENNREPYVACSSPGPGSRQEASRTSKSLTSRSHMEKTKQASPEAQPPSTSDLELSLSCPSGTSTWQGEGGLGAEATLPQASLGHSEGFLNAGLCLPTESMPLRALPEPQVPTTLLAPPEATPTVQAPGWGDGGGPLVLEKAGPPGASGFLPEILSPVDEQLSYGSGDLPSSAHIPALPPSPAAKSDVEGTISSDFPSPPEEAMFPSSLADLEEDSDSSADGLPSSSSQEALEEALALGPQEAEFCLGGQLSGSGSLTGSPAAPSQGSERVHWPTPPLSGDRGSTCGGVPRPAKSPTAFRMGCGGREGLARPLVANPEGEPQLTGTRSSTQHEPQLSVRDLGLNAGSTLDRSLGNVGQSKKGVQCFEGAEDQHGSEDLLDRRAPESLHPWPAAPPPGPVLLVAEGQVGSLQHAGEDGEGGLSRQADDQPRLQGFLGRDRDTDPASGTERVVDLVSTQLSRRILCVSLAAISGLNPQDSA
ncbi:coiled-coil domain-containing protein 187 [Dipodomys spectabilis]|uniref:coiled-coil domain-containing protein 187 n=1 Tax=Dipodomys spectabilis TaxID=105255 RepID=UPI001C544E90|nr:coiled-coil domain-containing protein 187 [Dipodomys spectabilis]